MSYACENLFSTSCVLILDHMVGLEKSTDMMRSIRVNKAERLLAIHSFVKGAMEKGILDVQMVNRLGARGGKRENNPDGGRLDDGTKSLIKINIGLLRVAMNDPSCLVSRQRAI